MDLSLRQAINSEFDRYPEARGGYVGPDEFDREITDSGFPSDPDYRWFVTKHGGGYIGGIPVFGLRRAPWMPSSPLKNSAYPSKSSLGDSARGGRTLPKPLIQRAASDGGGTAPSLTAHFRKLGWHGVDTWLIISIDGSGNPIGIAPDGKIYVSDPMLEERVLELADCFESLVRGELSG